MLRSGPKDAGVIHPGGFSLPREEKCRQANSMSACQPASLLPMGTRQAERPASGVAGIREGGPRKAGSSGLTTKLRCTGKDEALKALKVIDQNECTVSFQPRHQCQYKTR